MAPLSEDHSMKSITSQSFFNNVSPHGYPTPKENNQKWKQFGLAQPTNKRPEEDSKMVVLCSMRHDYGSNGLGGY